MQSHYHCPAPRLLQRHEHASAARTSFAPPGSAFSGAAFCLHLAGAVFSDTGARLKLDNALTEIAFFSH